MLWTDITFKPCQYPNIEAEYQPEFEDKDKPCGKVMALQSIY